MPKRIGFLEMSGKNDNTLACVFNWNSTMPKKQKKYDGYFAINKKFFKDPIKYVEDYINDAVKNNIFIKDKNGKMQVNNLFASDICEILPNMIKDFKQNKTFNSAVRLKNAIDNCYKSYITYKNLPFGSIQVLAKSFSESEKDLLAKKSIKLDLDAIKKLPTKEQDKIREEMFIIRRTNNMLFKMNKLIEKDKDFANELVQKGILKEPKMPSSISGDNLKKIYKCAKEKYGDISISPIRLGVQNLDKTSPFRTIYHEMGHIQDDKIRCYAIHDYDNDYNKYPQELKDWVDNEENMKIVKQVSDYAASGPYEFIAETFADLVEGRRTLPKDVINLYKKMESPMLPDMK